MSRKDPEERRAYNAAYEATNREKINARKAAYRAANIGKVRAQRAASWLAGKEKYAAYAEAYRQTPEAKSHMKAHGDYKATEGGDRVGSFLKSCV